MFDGYQFYDRYRENDPRAIANALRVGAYAGSKMPVIGPTFSGVLVAYADAAGAIIEAGYSVGARTIERDLKYLGGDEWGRLAERGNLGRVLRRRSDFEAMANRMNEEWYSDKLREITRRYQIRFVLHLLRAKEGVGGLRLAGG